MSRQPFMWLLIFVMGWTALHAKQIDAQDLRSGLEAHWTFDEGSGSVAADSSGIGRDALFRNGDPIWTEGVFGGALEFDGFSDLEVDWFGIEGDEPRSVSFWIRSDWLTIPGNNGIVGWGVQEATRKYHIRFHGDGSIRTENEGGNNFGTTPVNDDEWHHIVSVFPEGGEVIGDVDHYVDGVLEDKRGGLGQLVDTATEDGGLPLTIGSRFNGGADGFWVGVLDDLRIYSRELTEAEVLALLDGQGFGGATPLKPGDADQDLDFDQLDLVQVQIAAKYLTGQPATWGEGDWDGGPGGEPGNPPAGNGVFDQIDIIAALGAGTYLTGPYAAIAPGGSRGDGQTSIVYDPRTGELSVDAPAGTQLTSINIDSSAGIFTGSAAANLGGSFDNDSDTNIFKATFGSSFGDISFGNVAQSGLSENMVAGDLTVVGSLAGGGDLGTVDLIYVPEPSSLLLLICGALAVAIRYVPIRNARSL